MLDQAIKKHASRVVLRHKVDGVWQEITYEELGQRVLLVAEALHELSVTVGDHVALFSENSTNWIEIYLAVVGLGAAVIPLDAKLHEQEVTHILHDSEARVLLATVRQYALIKNIEDKLSSLRAVVIIDGEKVLPTEISRVRYEAYESILASMTERAQSDSPAYNLTAPQDDDIASIIYTSGTTGRPKGAMLSHKNFISDTNSIVSAFSGVAESDNFLMVLPLHHAFAFTASFLLPFALGSSISIVESLRTIAENMRETQPTVLIGVPLLLDKMYGRIETGIKKSLLARFLIAVGLTRVVGKKILAKLGGKLRVVVCGGAPCDPDMINGWARLGLLVREGYGLTESAPVLTVNPPELNKPGTVGKPLPGIDMRIDDANELGIGEILASGDNIMLGYYKNQDATDEVIQDGWLHTGDLGSFDTDGYLTISGRKKSLIVNREGKNIYPEEVEAQLLKSDYISEALVLGYLEPGEKVGERVGVIVIPDQENILADKPHQTDEQIIKLMQKEVRKQSQALSEYKRPRCTQVRFEEFMKTSTQKIKRYLYSIDPAHL